MKANELRIGNWYNEFGIPKQATSEFIDRLFKIQNAVKIAVDVSDIPLTKDWFLKFGFIPIKDIYILGDITLQPEKNGYQVVLTGDDPYCGHFVTEIYRYVHQLQNLYFALEGKELSIEL
jgi:hypothetical protein